MADNANIVPFRPLLYQAKGFEANTGVGQFRAANISCQSL
jgi:hypothetical protein